MTLHAVPFSFADHGHLIVETSANDGSRKWRNSIDIVWDDGAGAPGPAETVVTKFYEFLQGIQRSDCHLSKARLAVWAKGNLPLADQPAYWESTLDLPCAATGSGTCYGGSLHDGVTPPGEICMLIKKPPFGRAFRAGNMFIRNSLDLGVFEATPGGPPVLTPGPDVSVPAAINAWCTSKLGAFVEEADLPRYCLVHAQKTAPDEYDVFETPIQTPVFARVTMHDIGRD